MFPSDLVCQAIEQSDAKNISWMMPVLNTREHGYQGGRDATHDDEQFVPERSVRAVVQSIQLRTAELAGRLQDILLQYRWQK